MPRRAAGRELFGDGQGCKNRHVFLETQDADTVFALPKLVQQ